MGEIIRVPNYSTTNIKQITVLDADAAASQTLIQVFNPSSFTVSDRILLGGGNTGNSETATVNAINSTTKIFTLNANLVNKHNKYESVSQLFGDSIRLYRSANIDDTVPSDDLFVTVTTVLLQGDDNTTDISDPSGGSDFWYKITYFNSVTLQEISLAQSITVRGGGYGRLTSIESILREAGLLGNQAVNDIVVAEKRDRAESEVLGSLASTGYVIPLQTPSGKRYIPPIVENIACLMSSGYLLKQGYGAATTKDTTNGQDRLNLADKKLKQIRLREIMLVDTKGSTLLMADNVAGWPNNTTLNFMQSRTVEPSHYITMDKVF